jgi:hypothetical protein|nr:MAG TPA: hypothetical protein [Caudoviricetes sp.]
MGEAYFFHNKIIINQKGYTMQEEIKYQTYGYQMALLAVEKEFGHEGLEKVVDLLRERDASAYALFLKNQIKAKKEENLPYWEVVNVDDKYKLTKA